MTTTDSPLNKRDPSGEFAHVLFGAGVGAAVGLIGQALADVTKLEFSGVASYIGSAVSGGVTGGIIAGTGGVSLLAAGSAAAAGGTLGNVTKQNIEIFSGQRENLNVGEIIQAGIVSGISAGVATKLPPIKLPSITAGRNSFSAVRSSTMTKLRNRTISNVAAQTVGKAIVAETISSAPSEVINRGLDFIYKQGEKMFNSISSPVNNTSLNK